MTILSLGFGDLSNTDTIPFLISQLDRFKVRERSNTCFIPFTIRQPVKHFLVNHSIYLHYRNNSSTDLHLRTLDCGESSVLIFFNSS